MTDPFTVLGLPPSASTAEVRGAFRRLALRHHPDRNPDDPGAADRFKRILLAYRAALRGPRTAAPMPPPPGPRPDRFGCASCGDTFPFPERCPRCGIALHDRHESEGSRVEDPRVDAWMKVMEARPAVEEPTSDRLPLPGLLAGGFLGAGALVWTLGGPVGPAILFAGFAAYVVLVEGHRMFEPVWLRRG